MIKWWIGLAMMACLPLQAAEVKKGYPASFELARMDASGERAARVLASGEALLLPGERVTVRDGAADNGDRVRIGLRLEIAAPEQGADRGKMILHSRVDLSTVEGRTRVQAPNNPDSFIEGPRVAKRTFNAESWRRLGDPTPIVVPFSHSGQRYRLTVIIDPVYAGSG